MQFLLYGANGYTGKLILEKAVAKGFKPVLAGRSENKLKTLAQAYNLPYVVFNLDKVAEIVNHLQAFPVVLNCAGPFNRTAQPMVEACLLANTHYLDITGEIAVFELIKSYHQKALENNIVLMPGVGFDVVPTDCLATYLHQKLPDATQLELAIMSLGGSISHGTLSTIIDNLGQAGAVRENGKITGKPLGHNGKWINFGNQQKFGITIPWGDISTAFSSTGIPNIQVFAAVPRSVYYILKLQALFNPLLRTKFIKNQLQRFADYSVTGPSANQNQTGKSFIWGKVRNLHGEQAEARLECPETYLLTAETALNIVQKMLTRNNYAGYQTPAGLFGYNLILEIAGTRLIDL